MTSLIASPNQAEFLRQAGALTAIYDVEGKVIGFFAPVALEHADKYAKYAALIDPDAVEKARAEPGERCSTEQALQGLQAMGRVG